MLHLEQRDEIRGIIIGAPLLLIALFCFGLAAIHPASGSEAKTAAASAKSANIPVKSTPNNETVSELSLLPMAKGSTKPLPAAGQTDQAGSMGTSTASPQSTKNSSAAVNKTQKASALPSQHGPAAKKYHDKTSIKVRSSGNGNERIRAIISGVLNGL